MLPTAARLSRHAASLIHEHVHDVLAPIWRSPSIGLAISGGVDSMALATICRDIPGAAYKPDLTGFIVDHGLRSDSAEEAHKVADELDRLDIRPKILKMKWKYDPSDLTSLETVARRKRYRLIGQACYEAGIRELLVGHHADDQAETVLIRTMNGYTGDGLRGMGRRVKIPNCEGLYGVDGSGEPTTGTYGMMVEGGGVDILRPLLPFSKEDLLEVCQIADTKWFEDPTNADRRFTMRNTVRWMQKEELLPAALTKRKLSLVAAVVQRRQENVKEIAKRALGRLPMFDLDLRFGKLTFCLGGTGGSQDLRRAEDYHTATTLLKRLLALVSPMRDISLQHLDHAVDFVFQDDLPVKILPKYGQLQVAGVNIQLSDWSEDHNNFVWIMHRQTPLRTELVDLPLRRITQYDTVTDSTWSSWTLWDNRYWIRVGHTGKLAPEKKVKFAVKFLTPELLGMLRTRISAAERASLTHSLGMAKETVWTLPVITTMWKTRFEEVVALPSLNWSVSGYTRRSPWERNGDGNTPRCMWEIRYQRVSSGIFAPKKEDQ